MIILDEMVWINEIDSWVSTKEYKEYVEYNKVKYNNEWKEYKKYCF